MFGGTDFAAIDSKNCGSGLRTPHEGKTMLHKVNRAMTAALVAGLALAILALQTTAASAHPRRSNGDAVAVAAFAAVIGTIATIAAQDRRERHYRHYAPGYYAPPPYYAPPRYYGRPDGYGYRRYGW